MSDKAQNLFDEAMQASVNGDTSRAVDLLNQAVEEDPNNIAAWEALSRQLNDSTERRTALTNVLRLDPDNEYAKNALESVDKPKGGDDHAELVPGIPMRQARTIGLGLVVYTLLVCGATLFITTTISNGKIARAQEIAQQYDFQTQTQAASNLTATQAVIVATQQSADATATKLVEVSPTPTYTSTRAFADLPTEIPPSPTATTQSFRVEATPPPLPGRILAWGGTDVRSKEYLQLRAYTLNQPGTFEDFLIQGQRELGRNPLITQDNTVTSFEQWRADAPRLYISSLVDFTPGGTLDALLGALAIEGLKDPSMSADGQRVAFIATEFNTEAQWPYLADLTEPLRPNFYKLSQDTATYTGITLSPDGTKAVAVRVDGGSTDLVVFDLTNVSAVIAPVALPPVGEGTPTVVAPTAAPINIPLRPLTTDGNSLIEGAPAFSPDGTQVVYEATNSSTPNNRDLYIVTVGTAPGTPLPIMTTEGNDVSPTFSPDGKLVAFASDRSTGIYNLFIYDTTTRSTYQLTEENHAVYPGSWVN